MCISQSPALLQCTDLHSAELHLLVFFHLTSICPDSVGQRRRRQEQERTKKLIFAFCSPRSRFLRRGCRWHHRHQCHQHQHRHRHRRHHHEQQRQLQGN